MGPPDPFHGAGPGIAVTVPAEHGNLLLGQPLQT